MHGQQLPVLKDDGSRLRVLIAALFLGLVQVPGGSCHARLMEPPSRSTMWRYGYPTPANYDDDGLYCGGISTQWKRNGGKCGICGDAWNAPKPRPNEAGGRFGRGIIVRAYKPGQVMEAVIQITTNHRGYFEFRLCPNNNPKKEATQECLDQYLLTGAENNKTRHPVGKFGRGKASLKLQLPQGLNCTQCVFQWTYVAGNNWGICSTGRRGLGCGPQETYRACADIAIGEDAKAYKKLTVPKFLPSYDYDRKFYDKSGRVPEKRRFSSTYKNIDSDNSIEGNETKTETVKFGARLTSYVLHLLNPG